MTVEITEPEAVTKRVADHLSEEVNSAITDGEVECLVAARRLPSGESQIVHIHNDGATECPLWGVLTPDPRVEVECPECTHTHDGFTPCVVAVAAAGLDGSEKSSGS